jgi:hypothetical protein
MTVRWGAGPGRPEAPPRSPADAGGALFSPADADQGGARRTGHQVELVEVPVDLPSSLSRPGARARR